MAAGYDTISGLVVGGSDSALAYYQNNVIGGENPFLIAADSFNDFGTAIQAKLEGEIMPPIPIPGAVWLFGSGLVALFAFARKISASA